jgi:hypothetical protein
MVTTSYVAGTISPKININQYDMAEGENLERNLLDCYGSGALARPKSFKLTSILVHYLAATTLKVASRSRDTKTCSARRSGITANGRQRDKEFLCTPWATAVGNADALGMLARP